MTLVTFMFGFSTACAIFTGTKVVQQVSRTWRRSRNIVAHLIQHPYIMMVSAEWVSSVIISIISYMFLNGVITPRFVPIFCAVFF